MYAYILYMYITIHIGAPFGLPHVGRSHMSPGNIAACNPKVCNYSDTMTVHPESMLASPKKARGLAVFLEFESWFRGMRGIMLWNSCNTPQTDKQIMLMDGGTNAPDSGQVLDLCHQRGCQGLRQGLGCFRYMSTTKTSSKL